MQIGFVPKSGRLLPTRTTIVAGLFSPTHDQMMKFNRKVEREKKIEILLQDKNYFHFQATEMRIKTQKKCSIETQKYFIVSFSKSNASFTKHV